MVVRNYGGFVGRDYLMCLTMKMAAIPSKVYYSQKSLLFRHHCSENLRSPTEIMFWSLSLEYI
jgi:hypothetical protein